MNHDQHDAAAAAAAAAGLAAAFSKFGISMSLPNNGGVGLPPAPLETSATPSPMNRFHMDSPPPQFFTNPADTPRTAAAAAAAAAAGGAGAGGMGMGMNVNMGMGMGGMGGNRAMHDDYKVCNGGKKKGVHSAQSLLLVWVFAANVPMTSAVFFFFSRPSLSTDHVACVMLVGSERDHVQLRAARRDPRDRARDAHGAPPREQPQRRVPDRAGWVHHLQAPRGVGRVD